MRLKSGPKFEEKLTLPSKDGMTNSVNFNASSGKSEILHLDVLLLSNGCYAWAKKNRWVIPHNTEEQHKIWGETDSCFGKWCEEFSEF